MHDQLFSCLDMAAQSLRLSTVTLEARNDARRKVEDHLQLPKLSTTARLPKLRDPLMPAAKLDINLGSLRGWVDLHHLTALQQLCAARKGIGLHAAKSATPEVSTVPLLHSCSISTAQVLPVCIYCIRSTSARMLFGAMHCLLHSMPIMVLSSSGTHVTSAGCSGRGGCLVGGWGSAWLWGLTRACHTAWFRAQP